MLRIIPTLISVFIIFSPLASHSQTNNNIFSRQVRVEAQEALNFYGFDAGQPDGIFGAGTRRAIINYQSAHGMQPTGEFSRATMGLLLQRYRADKSTTQAKIPSAEPPQLSAAIGEIGKMCNISSSQLLSKQGFMQRSDMNGDGDIDFLIDGSASGCMFVCGASNCQVMAIVSGPNGYVRNDFLGYGVTPSTFRCDATGKCEFAR